MSCRSGAMLPNGAGRNGVGGEVGGGREEFSENSALHFCCLGV